MKSPEDAEAAAEGRAFLNGVENRSKNTTSIADTMLSFIWAVAHTIMSIVFFYSGFVQLNDPDWLLWLLGYKLTGLVCIGLVGQSLKMIETVKSKQAAQIMALLAGLSLIFHSIIHRENVDFSIYTEEGREAMGLALICLWMTTGWIATPSPKTTTTKSCQNVGSVAIATMVVAFCTAVLLSIWAVPRFLLGKEDLTIHCQGLGFGPQEPEL
mmetsp:Transcript_26378/g.38975  ORF Transcript_26378/g.38975 Transcript_26378/m.38975 type:complete len:212 (+) Transcript_26378:28-663(+)